MLSVFILLRAYGSDAAPSFDLGLTGRDPAALETTAAALDEVAARRGIELITRLWDDEATAEEALLAGRLDAVLQEDGTLVGKASVPPTLTQLVQDAVVPIPDPHSLDEAGVPPDEIDDLLNQPAIEVRTLEPQDPNRDENAGIAFIAVLLAYGQLFGYGVWVATGVIEEKASRVVEILLSAIRPRQLLAGKIAGIGLLGIVQLAFIATFAIGLSLVTGALELPATAVGIALVVLAWFVMGFAFYAGLFAVSGSLVSRMEELQNAMVPINLIIFVSFFISIGALENPDSTLSVVASVLPFSSALAMPVRIALGSATAAQIALSIVAARRRYGGARAALRPAVRGGGAEDRLPRETPRGVAVGRVERRRDGGCLSRWARPAGRGRTCGTRSPCSATARNPAATVYDSIGSDFSVALAPGWLNLGLWEGDGSDPDEAPVAVRRLVETIAAELPTGGDVLDVGNGLGEQDPLIAQVAETRSLTAVNITLSQLVAGTPRLAEAGARGVNADATRLPLRSGSFDGVISVEAAFHFPSRAPVLRRGVPGAAAGRRAHDVRHPDVADAAHARRGPRGVDAAPRVGSRHARGRDRRRDRRARARRRVHRRARRSRWGSARSARPCGSCATGSIGRASELPRAYELARAAHAAPGRPAVGPRRARLHPAARHEAGTTSPRRD